VTVLSLLTCCFNRTPETFNIVANVLSVGGRKNLAQISKILAQITTGSEFGEDAPACVPINLYVQKAISQMMAWAIDGKTNFYLDAA
jgi:Ras GTPase-activating-like protein IQGAP2/3